MASEPYLLDTGVLLHWLRGGEVSRVIDGQFQLTTSRFRPLISEVTWGELEAFAMSAKWGDERKRKLTEVKSMLVLVDLSDDRIMKAYAEFSTLAKQQGMAIFHDKNDLWIAACAKATGARVLTMDARAFSPLRNDGHLDAVILDAKTGWEQA
jgi:tRNA(fMet)-specific endonuclease VapC